MDKNASMMQEESERNMRATRKLSALEENFLRFVDGPNDKFEPPIDAEDLSIVSSAQSKNHAASSRQGAIAKGQQERAGGRQVPPDLHSPASQQLDEDSLPNSNSKLDEAYVMSYLPKF